MQMNRNIILQFSTKLKKSHLKKSQNKNYLEKTQYLNTWKRYTYFT